MEWGIPPSANVCQPTRASAFGQEGTPTTSDNLRYNLEVLKTGRKHSSRFAPLDSKLDFCCQGRTLVIGCPRPVPSVWNKMQNRSSFSLYLFTTWTYHHERSRALLRVPSKRRDFLFQYCATARCRPSFGLYSYRLAALGLLTLFNLPCVYEDCVVSSRDAFRSYSAEVEAPFSKCKGRMILRGR